MTSKPRISLTAMVTTVFALCAVVSCGCQGIRHWWHNDKKVGPNYVQPAAPVAADYAEFDSPMIDTSTLAEAAWWHVFNDPVLDLLIDEVHQQNLSLKAANWRITEARALRNIAAANLFPQSQTLSGRYARAQISPNAADTVPGSPTAVSDWTSEFDVSWEIDLWGRIRRSIAASDNLLYASIKDYDFALVTLIGDVASLYIQIRSLDERLELAHENVRLQEGSLDVAEKRFNEGRTSKLDVVQAKSNLAATKSLIPRLELSRGQAVNALSVLLGTPPSEFIHLDAPGKIPEIPSQAIVGIPADLLLQRPDIRAAERRMAAQFEQIGIAEAALYPTLGLNGTLGYRATTLSGLFNSESLAGAIAPGFQWNVLNYGRLKNNIQSQRAIFNQIRFDFENSVLLAQREVEDGIIDFVKSSERYEFVKENAEASEESLQLVTALYKEGKEDFGRVFVVQSNLVLVQDRLVETKANIALGLVRTYKSLGGGWDIRCNRTVSRTLSSEPDSFPPLHVEQIETHPADTPADDLSSDDLIPIDLASDDLIPVKLVSDDLLSEP